MQKEARVTPKKRVVELRPINRSHVLPLFRFFLLYFAFFSLSFFLLSRTHSHRRRFNSLFLAASQLASLSANPLSLSTCSFPSFVPIVFHSCVSRKIFSARVYYLVFFLCVCGFSTHGKSINLQIVFFYSVPGLIFFYSTTLSFSRSRPLFRSYPRHLTFFIPIFFFVNSLLFKLKI